ncbi:MAG: alpha/beta fold hydrolase [Chloroflexota bacterium]|nr:alpha/beta fold hydrolase [Chloroflexota bacterium]
MRFSKKPFNRVRFYRMVAVALVFTLVFSYVAISVYGALALTTSGNRDLGPDTPAMYGLAYENVTFKTAAQDGLNLRGWLIPDAKTRRVLILVPGQGGKRTDQLVLSKTFWDNGFNLLYMDPRGHGQSDGDHHTFGQYEQWDVIGAVNFLKGKGFKPENIGVIGWSMGAATALLAIGQTPDIKAVVSDSGYADLTSMHGIFSPGIMIASRLLRGIDTTQVKPEEALRKLGQRHVLVIHGDQDRNVPVSNAYRLQQAGGATQVELWVLPGVGHVGAYGSQPDEYMRRVTTFFNQELEP